MKNQKPNSRSRSGTSNNIKHKVPKRSDRSQNPPEIIVLPGRFLPDNKPNPNTEPVETPVEKR